MTRAFRPRRLDEALTLLADAELGAVPVAGCTDLLATLHASRKPPKAVVDLLGLAELAGIRVTPEAVDIGAAVTFSEIRASSLIAADAPLLGQAAAMIGAWQIQNRATLGGNIANASPAGDSLPVLLASGAELVVASAHGERRIPYGAFHVDYRKTALAPGEIILRVHVPRARRNVASAFRKIGTRAAQSISKVVVAFCAERDGATLRQVRLAAGSVARTPVRLHPAEAACEGAPLSVELAERAAAVAAAAISPIDDVRSTAEYRRWVLGQVVRRMLVDLQ